MREKKNEENIETLQPERASADLSPDELVGRMFFRCEEMSAGHYQVEGTDVCGRTVAATGINPDDLLKRCVADAKAIKEEIEIWGTRSKKSKSSGHYYMLVNDDIFVDSYEWQLNNIMYHLLRHTTMDARLGLNADGKHRIDALRLTGLCNVEKVRDTVLGIISRCNPDFSRIDADTPDVQSGSPDRALLPGK